MEDDKIYEQDKKIHELDIRLQALEIGQKTISKATTETKEEIKNMNKQLTEMRQTDIMNQSTIDSIKSIKKILIGIVCSVIVGAILKIVKDFLM